MTGCFSYQSRRRAQVSPATSLPSTIIWDKPVSVPGFVLSSYFCPPRLTFPFCHSQQCIGKTLCRCLQRLVSIQRLLRIHDDQANSQTRDLTVLFHEAKLCIGGEITLNFLSGKLLPSNKYSVGDLLYGNRKLFTYTVHTHAHAHKCAHIPRVLEQQCK